MQVVLGSLLPAMRAFTRCFWATPPPPPHFCKTACWTCNGIATQITPTGCPTAVPSAWAGRCNGIPSSLTAKGVELCLCSCTLRQDTVWLLHCQGGVATSSNHSTDRHPQSCLRLERGLLKWGVRAGSYLLKRPPLHVILVSRA